MIASHATGSTTRALGLLAHAGMFVFGLTMALIGAVVPALSERLSLTLAFVGTMFLVMNAAMLLASLALGLIVDRVGLKPALAAGAWLVAIGLLIVASATHASHLLPAVACLGFGGGALNGGTNTLVADLHDDPARKAAALNLLGVFFGVGALFLPFTIGALTATLGMATLLIGAAALCAATGGFAAMLTFPPPKQQGGGWPFADFPRLLRMPIVLAFGALLFFQSGNEFALGGYVSSFLTRDLRLPLDAASYALAGYWASIMAARLILSRLALRLSAAAVIVGSALCAAAGALVLAAAPTPTVAIAGALLTGFALAGVFPTVLALAGTRFRERSGTVFGLLFTMALSGGLIVPWLAGHLAEAAGLRWVFVLTAITFAIVALLGLASRRMPA